jgi:hypothetical protein
MEPEQKMPEAPDIRRIVQESIEEYTKRAAEQNEPAVKAELAEERRRREQLERRLNELIDENDRQRKAVEQADRFARIKAELQELGVKKPELAFRVVKDEVFRGEDGKLYARAENGDLGLKEFLAAFIERNPEFLPARIAGGSGASGNRQEGEGGGFDLGKIRPGMSKEEKEKARKEIARIAGKESLGWL